ncbi:MAG: ATP-binding cassette domain-containing protein, partial [Chloroflexota bacterium]
MTVPVIATVGLTKTYRQGAVSIEALNSVSVEIAAGEFVAVVGPSGSGKSTFLGLIGCLDQPTAGTYALEGREVQSLR